MSIKRKEEKEMKFRKKPVIIKAIQWKGNNFNELEEFGSQDKITSNSDGTLTIETLEGNHTAKKGDWIIQGIQGELYPCKPDIFEETYEEVNKEKLKIWTAEETVIKYNSSKIANKEFVALEDLKERISEIRWDADIAGLQDTEIVLQEIEKSIGLREKQKKEKRKKEKEKTFKTITDKK